MGELLELAKLSAFNALLRGFEGFDEYTRFYIGWLQMNGMGDTDFDDAAKFARVGMSVNISDIFDKHLLIRTGNKQHLATYKERVVKDKLGIEASDPLIDQVHRAMDNWHSGDRGKILRHIKIVGSEASSPFWRVLASLKELLPEGDDLTQVQGLISNSADLIQHCSDEPFTIRLCIPYIGFSLKDATDNNVQGDIEVNHKDAASYAYMFVGNDTNDRFQLSLDGGRLSYMCVANDEGTLSVRNIHDNLSLVTELPLQGTLDELLMGAHSALIKNKSARWRVELVGDEVEGADSLELNGVSLARFAFGLFTAEENVDEDSIAQRLMHMEQRLGFQWFWVDEADWSHENMEGLMDMEGLDADPEKMMRQALLFNRYETFMRRLCAFSYATHNNIQGDQLQARNNKRKIARCVRRVLAHRAGEESLWSLDEEARRENLHFFSTFHREFTQALEE